MADVVTRSLSLLWVVLLFVLAYTLVSGPNGPLTRRYAPRLRYRLVVTTPTAHSSFCIVFSGFVLGLAVWGIITAEAVMLFRPRFAGVSGAWRLPCADAHQKTRPLRHLCLTHARVRCGKKTNKKARERCE